MTFIKARENFFKYSSHGLLGVAEVSQLILL